MNANKKKFLNEAKKVAFDLQHRKTIKFNISKYHESVEKGLPKYSDLELARERASAIKTDVINNLHKYLLEFEENFSKVGGKLFWADDSSQAITKVKEILKEKDTDLIVKSKSMTTEEINFNSEIEKLGIEVLETDLGEFIVQQAGEPPYHIVTPAMHKSKEDVAELYHEKFNTPENSSPKYLTEYTRNLLREKFTKAKVGITGANFLIADTGAVALTENEGNILMTMSFPETHIVIAGIEKFLPSINDLSLFWQLLSHKGTGQSLSAFNSIITGACKNNETNGPKEMYVILLDNGRSKLFNMPKQKEVLKCIRCGACLNNCPIYHNIGGYTYNSTYSGPIGSVITPFFKGFEKFGHLSFACTLCGKCTEVCPVKINLTDLLLYNRNEAVKTTKKPFLEKNFINIYMNFVLSRKKMDFFGKGLKNFGMSFVAKKLWGKQRRFPKFKP